MRCFKCSDAAAVVASREGKSKSLCAACLTDFVVRNSRDELFRHCFVPSDKPVAIAVSGGLGSMAVAHLLGVLRQQNLQRGGGGKIDFNFHLVHVDESELLTSSLLSSSEDEARVKPDVWRDLLEPSILRWNYSGSPLFTKDRIHVFTVRQLLEQCGLTASSSFQTIVDVLGEAQMSLTDRLIFYDRLKHQLIHSASKLAAAAAQGADGDRSDVFHVITGEDAVGCASRALSSVVLGKGEHITDESGTRGASGGVNVLRPLTGLLPKELLFYAKLNGVAWSRPFVDLAAVLPLRGGPRRTVQRTIEDFLVSLMVTFRSTVFNVINTVAKISPASLSTGGSEGPPGAGAISKAERGRLILSKATLAAKAALADRLAATSRRSTGVGSAACTVCGMLSVQYDSCSACRGCALLLDAVKKARGGKTADDIADVFLHCLSLTAEPAHSATSKKASE